MQAVAREERLVHLAVLAQQHFAWIDEANGIAKRLAQPCLEISVQFGHVLFGTATRIDALYV